MKRFALFLIAFAFVGEIFADGQLIGAAKGGGTNRVVVSKTVTEKAWERNVVTVDDLGQIHGDGGVVAEAAETSAINDVATRSGEIADSADASMKASLTYFMTKTNNMATAGLGIAIAFPPETDDPNIRGFVVLSETEGVNDVQWVHYNRELSLPPNRTVVYERNDGTVAKVKANWGKWDSAGTNLTVSGRSWNGVHRCTVARPTWAQGRACLDLPNEPWGGENGMDFGDIVLTHSGGIPYFTGYVTNGVAGVVAYFDNGFLKELKPIGE